MLKGSCSSFLYHYHFRYITATASIIYMIRFKEPYKSKYDKSQDSFLHFKFAVAPLSLIHI